MRIGAGVEERKEKEDDDGRGVFGGLEVLQCYKPHKTMNGPDEEEVVTCEPTVGSRGATVTYRASEAMCPMLKDGDGAVFASEIGTRGTSPCILPVRVLGGR